MAGMRTLILAGLAAALLTLAVVPATASAAGRYRNPCAGRLCLEDRPEAKGCRELFRSRHRVARCFIVRAARHFRESPWTALRVARCESGLRWWVTNAYGYRGLFQFGSPLWRSTPYRRFSPHQPRYAALAAMWVWSRGGYSHWVCY